MLYRFIAWVNKGCGWLPVKTAWIARSRTVNININPMLIVFIHITQVVYTDVCNHDKLSGSQSRIMIYNKIHD